MKKLIINLVMISVFGCILSACSTISKETCETGDWRGTGFEAFGNRGKIIDSGWLSSDVFSPKKDLQKYVEKCNGYQLDVNQDEYWDGYKSAADLYCVYEKGYSTGTAGRTKPYACTETHSAEYELDQNFTEFNRGREEGLNNFCTLPNALALGEAGEYYYGVCKDESIRQEFLITYKTGLRDFCTFEKGYLHAETDTPKKKACTSNSMIDYSTGYEEAKAVKIIETEYKALNLELIEFNSEIRELQLQLRSPDLTEDHRRKVVSSIEELEVKQSTLIQSISSLLAKYSFLED